MIVAQTELGRGVLGVVDGTSPLGVETGADIAWRKDLLRKTSYCNGWMKPKSTGLHGRYRQAHDPAAQGNSVGAHWAVGVRQG